MDDDDWYEEQKLWDQWDDEYWDEEPLRCEADVKNGVCLSILSDYETCPRADRHLEP